jgi:hypothetical protein
MIYMELKNSIIAGGICAALGLVAGAQLYFSKPNIEVKQVCSPNITIGTQYSGSSEKIQPYRTMEKDSTLEQNAARFDYQAERISQSLDSSREYLRSMRENARAGCKALEDGLRVLHAGSGKVPTGPDPVRIPDIHSVPTGPDYQPLFGKDGLPKDKEEGEKK